MLLTINLFYKVRNTEVLLPVSDVIFKMKKAGEQKFKNHFISLTTALDCLALACFYKAIPNDQTLSKRFLVIHFGMKYKMTVHTEFSAR